jgi:DNA-binding PucR family transcriptional regulator
VATSVGPVAEHDRRTRGDLLRTLRIYMEREGNMRATADASFAHRHTVASRLDRIHELTGHDPRRPAGQEALGLGLKALAVREAGPGH